MDGMRSSVRSSIKNELAKRPNMPLLTELEILGGCGYDYKDVAPTALEGNTVQHHRRDERLFFHSTKNSKEPLL